MAPAHARLERSTIVALAAMALAVFVIANDVTALSVALRPSRATSTPTSARPSG